MSRSRFSTEALLSFVSNSPKLSQIIRPDRLVGHNEMTDEQDRVVIENLRYGKINLLIATDIAQEGVSTGPCRDRDRLVTLTLFVS